MRPEDPRKLAAGLHDPGELLERAHELVLSLRMFDDAQVVGTVERLGDPAVGRSKMLAWLHGMCPPGSRRLIESRAQRTEMSAAVMLRMIVEPDVDLTAAAPA